MARRRQSSGRREYPRTARVNELVREIIGDELERIDDPRLEMVSITAVDIEQELTQGVVFFSSFNGPDADQNVLAALSEHRARLQASIARQSRMRRTPSLRFSPDGGVRDGMRIEEILRDIGPLPETEQNLDDPNGPYKIRPERRDPLDDDLDEDDDDLEDEDDDLADDEDADDGGLDPASELDLDDALALDDALDAANQVAPDGPKSTEGDHGHGS
jgi:ribosome-binding factor A